MELSSSIVTVHILDHCTYMTSSLSPLEEHLTLGTAVYSGTWVSSLLKEVEDGVLVYQYTYTCL